MNKLFYQLIKRSTILFIMTGIAFLLATFTGSSPVQAGPPVTINWGDISPDIGGTPDFLENDAIAPETDTYFSNHSDPFHGLGSSSGGLSGFSSQSFTNVNNSDVDLTVYYSDNNYDGANLEGPDLYQPISNPNPDARVTGEWLLRVTRDHIGTRTPTTVVLVFSEPILMDEFIIGSLSIVGSSHEHAYIRAFSTADATGAVVKASEFINISNLPDCTTLDHNQCNLGAPLTSNNLNNVVVNPDITDGNNDGVYENVGNAGDDGIYHVYGNASQGTDAYGRVKVVYDTAIRSIAVSYFPTLTGGGDEFNDTSYSDQWISTIMAPFTFHTEDTTAITLSHSSVSLNTNTFILLLGVALMTIITIGSLTLRRRAILRQH